MKRIVWAGIVALAFSGIACDETAKGARREAGETASEAKQKAEQGADKVEEAAKEAGSFIDAKKQTIDVKGALMADTTIDASDIDVDTSADTKTVTLTGTVPTAAQKEKAEALAKQKSEGYSVVSKLTLRKDATPPTTSDAPGSSPR